MEFSPQDDREKLRPFQYDAGFPPMALYQRMRLLLGEAEPEAAFVESAEDDDNRTVVLWALLPGRLIRVVGVGKRGWDGPSPTSPETVTAIAWTLDSMTKVEVSESHVWGGGFALDIEWHSAIVAEFGADRIDVPHLAIPNNSHERAALESLIVGLIQHFDQPS